METPQTERPQDDLARDSARGAPEAHYHQDVSDRGEPVAHMHQEFPHAAPSPHLAETQPPVVVSAEDLRAQQDLAENLRRGDGLAA